MRRLDAGAMPASDSDSALRFLFSGTSAVAIVNRFGEKGSVFLKRVQFVNWLGRSFEACQLRLSQRRSGPVRVMHWQFLGAALSCSESFEARKECPLLPLCALSCEPRPRSCDSRTVL
jgi:hypothetical protein